jgi:hypothetical protein
MPPIRSARSGNEFPRFPSVFLKTEGEGKAELWIGYDGVPPILRTQFERFIHAHLERRAISGTVTRERQYSCPNDNTAFNSEQVQQVRDRGRDSILCPVCEKRATLRDDYEPTTGADHSIAAMDKSRQFVRRRCPVIPVLLAGAERPELPALLDGMTWVDLAASDPDPLDQLEWGITGRHPDR